MTARSLLAAFGAEGKVVPLPVGPFRLGHRAARRVVRLQPRLEGRLRRLELLAFGQRVEAVNLSEAGFAPPADFEAYVRLAQAVRPLEESR